MVFYAFLNVDASKIPELENLAIELGLRKDCGKPEHARYWEGKPIGWRNGTPISLIYDRIRGQYPLALSSAPGAKVIGTEVDDLIQKLIRITGITPVDGASKPYDPNS